MWWRLGRLRHKAALQLGLLWVPAWHHTAGARCSSLLRWGRHCDSPGAAAGAAPATCGRTLPCPGYRSGCQRPSGRGRVLAGAGSTAEVGCWIWSLHTRRGGSSWQARYALAAQGVGTRGQRCRSSHHRLHVVFRGIWDVLMPCEALDCQRVALTPVQHRTLSISEHLLPPGVSARLGLVPMSCAFLPVSRFLQLHSLSPAARQR